MTEESVHRLLLDCGFRGLPWKPLRGQRWAVVGELDGGLEITVACTPGPVLHVPSQGARELLAEMLSSNGAGDVEIRATPPVGRDGSSWIPLAIGVGAVALFGWIVSSIAVSR
jgi:hypothetical protein